MADREKVIKAYEDFVNGYECFCTSDDYEYEMHKAVLALLKEQERLLRKKQKDIDKLCVEYSNLKHRFHEKTELVRCKDCRHWIGGGIDSRDNFIPPRCTLFNEPQSADWYCPAGQRRETK